MDVKIAARMAEITKSLTLLRLLPRRVEKVNGPITRRNTSRWAEQSLCAIFYNQERQRHLGFGYILFQACALRIPYFSALHDMSF